MGRHRFDHIAVEFTVAVGEPISRYALWLTVHDAGLDPEALTQRQALQFCKQELRRFAAERGLRMGFRAHRRLLREVEFFDPEIGSPAERLGFDDGY